MTSEERQRTLREAGSGPAEAEKQEGARESRESLRRQEGERAAEDRERQTDNTPMAEDDDAPLRPRR